MLEKEETSECDCHDYDGYKETDIAKQDKELLAATSRLVIRLHDASEHFK